MQPTTAALTADSRCTIYGRPGRVITVDEDCVLVALDDEGGRKDWWATCQVEPVSL